jgi:hypothetical protein
MTTLEEQYNIEVKAILARYPAGSEEREEAKRALWEKYQADKFEQSGDLSIIYNLQKRLGADLYALISAFYDGTLEDADYRVQRIAAFRKYCSRMVELGLASSVPGDAWITVFSNDGIDFERNLVPPKTSGLTQEDILLLLCDPARDKMKEGLLAFHTEFGTAKLKSDPAVYGGVVESLKDEEQEKK